jgi:hypothetical protein
MEMTGMPNQDPEKANTSLYQCIGKACLTCRSTRRCPALIVVAVRYAEELAKEPDDYLEF